MIVLVIVTKISLESTAVIIIIFIRQYMVDMLKIIQQTKNLNNLTKQMFEHNIQFVNNIFFQTVCITLFSECCSFVKNLSNGVQSD